MFRPGPIYQNTTMNVPVVFRDQDGVLTDPDTLVFKIYSPVGTETTYTYGTDSEFEKTAIGKYNIDFDVGEYAGRWHWLWYGTSGLTKIAKEGSFVVQTSPFYEQAGADKYRRNIY